MTSKRPTDALIKQQADRLLTLPNNPGDSRELAIALKRFGKTEYHVKAITQYLLDTQTFFPTPSAIRDAADMVPSEAPPKYKPANPDCEICLGTGFMHEVRGGYEGSGVCNCRQIGGC